MSYEQKMSELQRLRSQVDSLSQIVQSKARNLDMKENQLRQGQISVENARDLEVNMNRNLGPMLAPGNLGDINKIIWPYYFSTELPAEPIGPNETFQTGFSITQEAAFIMMSYTKVVYDATPPFDVAWQYLNPNEDGIDNLAPELTFTFRDGSSSRQFFNSAIEIGHYGNPRFPTKFPRPIMFLPNQSVQVAFVNSHPTREYVPILTAFGYRMRIEDAQNLLSLVYG
jgi:hypothetical protein